jgi:hypothetical protein
MEGPINTLALYTTIYPGVEPYLQGWCRSVQNQTDKDYQLWIGLDAISVEAAMEAMGSDPKATWVPAFPGDTPAQVRQRAFERIVKTCDGVVLVDSDDILHDSRVAAAREALQMSDLAGCALRLVDHQGSDMDLTFGLPAMAKPENVLPRNNVFGLSNSAFRSELLCRCLPIPANVVLVDWFLSTRAWLFGVKLTFDPAVRMDYRQHDKNMTRVRSPFSSRQIIHDTESVLHHFRIVRAASEDGSLAGRLAELDNVAADVAMFHRNVILQPTRLESYVQALNTQKLAPLWWSSVAHPSLRHMWTQ